MSSRQSLTATAKLVEDVSRQLMEGRYDKLHHPLAPSSEAVIGTIYRDLQTLQLSQHRDRVRELFGRMELECRHLHQEGAAGLREAAALLIIATMGTALSRFEDVSTSTALSRLWVELAFLLQGRPVRDSIGGLFIHFFAHNLRAQFEAFLRIGRELYDKALAEVVHSDTVDNWLVGLGRLALPNEAQYLTYSYLLSISEGEPGSRRLEQVAGIDVATCERRQNEHDEVAAHSRSPGLYQFQGGTDPFEQYLLQIVDVATKEGTRVAQRRTRIDVARLIVPPAFGAYACQVLATSGTGDPRN